MTSVGRIESNDLVSNIVRASISQTILIKHIINYLIIRSQLKINFSPSFIIVLRGNISTCLTAGIEVMASIFPFFKIS